MKITIREEGKKPMNIRLPSALVLNNLSARLIVREIAKKANSDVKLTYPQAKAIVAAIRRAKKIFPDWVLVEIDEKDGEYVEIHL